MSRARSPGDDPVIREAADGTANRLVIRTDAAVEADGDSPDDEALDGDALDGDALDGDALDGVDALHLQGDDVFGSERARQLLDRARGSDLSVSIDSARVPDPDVAIESLRDVAVASLLAEVTDAAPEPIERIAAIAAATGAVGQIRFVLTPNGWFELEDAARLAASKGLRAELSLEDHRDDVPLEPISPEAASFLRDAIVDCWPRLSGNARPDSLDEGGFEQLTHDLRALVGRSLEAAAEAPEAQTGPIALPPLAHGWNTDPERRGPWHARLFVRSLTATVGDWVDEVATPDSVRELVWLRALVQRIAFDHEPQQLLDLLGRVYKKSKDHQELHAQDADYAESFELARFGGPWFDRIGLGARQRRARPFQVREPSPVSDAPADTTVLIPSYRHQKFIKETIASVLAQQDAAFRVLVADDRSPDDTVEVARSVDDPRVTVTVNDDNVGLGNSVLQALEHVDTPYVALLNSDDLLHPEHLATCRAVLEADAEAQLVCTDLQPIDSLGRSLRPDNVSLVRDGSRTRHWIEWFEAQAPSDDLAPADYFGELLERNYLITSSNLFARTDWLRAQAGSLQSLKYCLDWRLFLQAAAESTLRHVHRPLIGYRLHASNTVWFDAERRYTYYLEVNRVAAEALREFSDRHPDREQAVGRVVRAVANHVIQNGETDGYALFLNAALDTLVLEREANDSPETMRLLRVLSDAADARRLQQAPPPVPTNVYLELDHLRSLLNSESGKRTWLESQAESHEQRIAELDRINKEIWETKQRLERDLKSLQQSKEQLRRESEQQLGRAQQQAEKARTQAAEQLEKVRAQLHKDLDWQRGETQKVQGILENTRDYVETLKQQVERLKQSVQELQDRNQRAQQAHEATRQQLDERRQELADTIASLDRTRGDLDTTRGELETARGELDTTRADLDRTVQDRDRQTARADQLERDLDERNRQHEDLRQTLAERTMEFQRNEAAIDRLLRSREHRIGDFVWNKLPFAWTSGKLRALNRKFHDARARRALQRDVWRPEHGALGRAVVASTFSWPIRSHTFVYQEVAGLIEAGLDVRFLHYTHEPDSPLHAAFAHLDDRTVRLRDLRSIARKDAEWFERTRPQRYRAFLERISKETARPVPELLQQIEVLRAFTFARYTELAGARYVHSYFCYDMSFMAMAAAWLLDLPRGLTCYADHMLRDDPYKLVPLHLEQCAIVVATSERVRDELSQLSGGRFDDKILVKPNGVDGDRFRPVETPAPAPGAPLELLSISRIEPKKGLTVLVEAIAVLREQGHDVRVHVVGGEDPNTPGSVPFARRFRERIAARGLGDRFELHGPMAQEQLAPLFARCHAFVAPYVEAETGDKDGIPTAILEAMASGMPIVATDSGSICEVFDDGTEGLIVPQRDAAAFAAAIAAVAGDDARRRAFGVAARARFERCFDVRVTEKPLHERIRAVLTDRD